MSDVVIIILVVCVMVGFGYAVKLVDDNKNHKIQIIKFIISFFLWSVLMGFKVGDDKW